MRLSLGRKIVLLLLASVLAVGGVALAISRCVVDGTVDGLYRERAEALAATVASAVDVGEAVGLRDRVVATYRSAGEWVGSDDGDSPAFEAYVGHFAGLVEAPEYRSLLARLRTLQGPGDAQRLYLVWVDPVGECVVHLVDAAETDPFPIGCADPLQEADRRVIEEPSVGLPARIIDTPGRGWLVSAGAPVLGHDGEVALYACADIPMGATKRQQAGRLALLAGVLLALAAGLGVAASLLVRRLVVGPIDALCEAATRYREPTSGARPSFSDIEIRTHDEIESLRDSMVRMERDIDTYIDNLVETRARLTDTRVEVDRMSDLAHRDALTGMGNKLAFDQGMRELDRGLAMGDGRFGVAVIDLNDLKVLNDRYGHDCGDFGLRRVSQIIRDVFSRSPAFRIGGDEFAAILRDEDYAEADRLVGSFRSVIEDLSGTAGADLRPWERVSAAIGYAGFDPRLDDGALDVFRRADEGMYQEKLRMKGGVAPR